MYIAACGRPLALAISPRQGERLRVTGCNHVVARERSYNSGVSLLQREREGRSVRGRPARVISRVIAGELAPRIDDLINRRRGRCARESAWKRLLCSAGASEPRELWVGLSISMMAPRRFVKCRPPHVVYIRTGDRTCGWVYVHVSTVVNAIAHCRCKLGI